jgi:hypothetical protein
MIKDKLHQELASKAPSISQQIEKSGVKKKKEANKTNSDVRTG